MDFTAIAPLALYPRRKWKPRAFVSACGVEMSENPALTV
jgi:hypothetical protein